MTEPSVAERAATIAVDLGDQERRGRDWLESSCARRSRALVSALVAVRMVVMGEDGAGASHHVQ